MRAIVGGVALLASVSAWGAERPASWTVLCAWKLQAVKAAMEKHRATAPITITTTPDEVRLRYVESSDVANAERVEIVFTNLVGPRSGCEGTNPEELPDETSSGRIWLEGTLTCDWTRHVKITQAMAIDLTDGNPSRHYRNGGPRFSYGWLARELRRVDLLEVTR